MQIFVISIQLAIFETIKKNSTIKLGFNEKKYPSLASNFIFWYYYTVFKFL